MNGLISALILLAGSAPAAGEWTHQQDVPGEPTFGGAVALGADIAFVGEPGADGAGTVHVYTRDAEGTWSSSTTLTLADAEAGDAFGSALALHGDTLVASAPGRGAGMVTVWEPSGGAWQPVATLTGEPGEGTATFGRELAFDGQTLVVGSPSALEEGKQGRAYVFYREHGGTSWPRMARLAGSESGDISTFGEALAVEGDRVLIGDSRDGTAAAGQGPGAVYVFLRDQGGADQWGEATLIRPEESDDWSLFGEAVALSGSTALIGASQGGVEGAAWVFEREAGTAEAWSEIVEIPSPTTGVSAFFGRQVTLDGPDRLLISTMDADYQGPAIYVFERSGPGADYAQAGLLSPPGTSFLMPWGERVDVHDGTLVAGGENLGQVSFFVFTEILACDPACANGGTCVEIPSCGLMCECTGGFRPPDCTTRCGDGTCDVVEGCDTCPQDCQPCDDCGDGVCRDEFGEDGVSCPDDCSAGFCGDLICEPGEDLSCPDDCGGSFGCGDGFCEPGEESSCPEDCGGSSGCGDGFCEPGETSSCPSDCGGDDGCGDGVCEGAESCDSCFADCGPCDFCGDGVCQEDCASCAADCGVCDDPCAGDPCLNGGGCEADCESFTFTCECTGGWSGDICEMPPGPMAPTITGTSPPADPDVCGDGSGEAAVVIPEHSPDGMVIQWLVDDPDSEEATVHLVTPVFCGSINTNLVIPPHQQLTGLSLPGAVGARWPSGEEQPSTDCDPCDFDPFHEANECTLRLIPLADSDGTGADSLRYTPYWEAGWGQFGLFDLTVTAFDGEVWSARHTTTVYVSPDGADPPVAQADALTEDDLSDGEGALALSAARLLDGGGDEDQQDYDTDISGGYPRGYEDPCGATDSLAVAEVRTVAGGHLVSATLDGDTVTVVPEEDFSSDFYGEPAVFEYRIVDGTGLYSEWTTASLPVILPCDPGFDLIEDECVQKADDCAADPCVNGTCSDPGPTFHCECEGGFKGPTCALAEGCGACEGARQVPGDPHLAEQGWIERIGAPWAWDVTTGQVPVRVALLSTGADPAHPDAPALSAADSRAWLPDGEVSPGVHLDTDGEGTWLAGIIGAPHDNGEGGAGLAPDVEIVMLAVRPNGGSAAPGAVAEAIEHAVSVGAAVIAVPLRLGANHAVVEQAVQSATEAGALVIAPAGGFPAAYPGVLRVGALEDDGGFLLPFEKTPDLLAPYGVSNVLDGGYGTYTSAAPAADGFGGPTAVAAGVAALVWSALPSPRGDRVRDLLIAAAEDVGKVGFDPATGAGVLRADVALALASGCETCPRYEDPCAGNPCGQGTCLRVGGDFACVCPASLAGRTCQRDPGACGDDGPADVERLPEALLELGVPFAWGLTRGEGATVAIIGSGWTGGHPDVPVVTQEEFGEGAQEASGRLDALAAIVAATDGAIGGVGVAPDAEVWIGELPAGDTGPAAAALDAAVAAGADVALLAFSGTSVALEQAVADARAAGVVVLGGASDAVWPGAVAVGAPGAGADVLAPAVTRAPQPEGAVEATLLAGRQVHTAEWVEGTAGQASVTGRIVACGVETALTCPGAVAGGIAHFRRGDAEVGEQVEAARKAGALGVVISNDQPGLLHAAVEPSGSPIPGVDVPLPVVTVRQAAGDALEALGEGGRVALTVSSSTFGTIIGDRVAAAHVAGVVALVRALAPDLSAGEVEQRLSDAAASGLLHAGQAVAGLTACVAETEICDGADNDCDGEVDEDFGIWLDPTEPAGGRVTCEGGLGICGAFTGVLECAGPLSTRCSVDSGGSAARSTCETCNGQDDDCDGLPDDGLGLKPCLPTGDPCADGVCDGGTCARLGYDGWACVCPDGLGGADCTLDLAPCGPDPCQNGGTCTETVPGEAVCSCPHPYAGKTCDVEKQSCNEPAATAGCADADLEACVCDLAPGCCVKAWSASCVKLAAQECGEPEPPEEPEDVSCVCDLKPQCCKPGGWKPLCAELEKQYCGSGGDCFSTHLARGCGDPDIMDCVCAKAPLCCLLGWTGACAAEAKACAGDEPLPGPGSCDAAHSGVGCKDKAVQSCVCKAMPHCCSKAWDAACAKVATESCQEPDGQCASHECPDDPKAAACVCGLVPSCCDSWSSGCQMLYESKCQSAPPPDEPDDPPPVSDSPPDPPKSDLPDEALGSCCTEHDSPGCDEPVTSGCVCDIRPDCCTDAWAPRCALIAWEVCDSFCSPGAPTPVLPPIGSDPGPLPDPGDLAETDPCYAAVAALSDEDCLSVEWHQEMEEAQLLAETGTPVLCLEERLEHCAVVLKEAADEAFADHAAEGPVETTTVIGDLLDPTLFEEARVWAVVAPQTEAPIVEPEPDHFDDWGADEAVSSCDEYVWQWLYDYRLWQKKSGGGSTYHAWAVAYVAAKDAGGIGRRGLDDDINTVRSLTEFPVDYHFEDDPRQVELGWEMLAPKNAFFGVNGAALEALFLNDLGLFFKVANGPSRSFYDRSNAWEFHREMGDMLITAYGWTASDLAWFDSVERDFRALLQERARAANERYRILQDGGDATEVDARIEALDDEIVTALEFADAIGCLDLADSTPCDWSPQDFVDEVTGYYGAIAEQERSRCEQLTGGDFEDLTWVKPASSGDGVQVVAQDPTVDDVVFRLYLADLEAALAQVAAQVAANADRLKLADAEVLPSKELGNDLFGVSMSWEASYGVQQPALDLDTGQCSFDMEARTSFAITASLFGLSDDLFAVSYDARIKDRVAFGAVEILDQTWSGGEDQGGGSATLPVNIVVQPQSPSDTTLTQTFFEYDEWFPIFFVPIHLEASVVGQLGAEIGVTAVHDGFTTYKTLDGETRYTCLDDFEMSLNGQVTPWAGLSLHAGAGIGIPGFEAGARGDLTFLRGSLPFTIDLEAEAQGDLADLDLTVRAELRRELQVLAGRVYAFLDYPCNWGLDTCTVTDPLFSWKGWNPTDTLYHHAATLAIGAVAAVCEAVAVIPGDVLDCEAFE